MDVIGALAEGKRGAVARSTEVATYVLQNRDDLSTLIEALRWSDETVVSHAAHACLTVFKKNPELLKFHKDALVETLQTRDQWEVIEQLSKILPYMDCSIEVVEGVVKRLNVILREGKSSIARTCALEAIVVFSNTYDQHAGSAEQALTYALEQGTKAMQARARKLVS